MDKKEFKEKMNLEAQTMVNLYPELNQSGYLDNKGNVLPKGDWEPYYPTSQGFVKQDLISVLTRSDFRIYYYLQSVCDKWRDTQVKTEVIIEDLKLSEDTIKNSLRKLEFYHFISRRTFFVGTNYKRRIIVLLRWDTAYKLLLKEGKIQANNENDVYLITPYLPSIKRAEQRRKKKKRCRLPPITVGTRKDEK
ncbi:hypothetical protein ES705_32247 [subsurface metagenome]|nr:hypothetical protein [Clostridia bacterium]